ncbi:MAG: hypothetical protein QGI08_00445 [Paracoccaceae bacterium]|nr:hypothetical protein [Paracoccaceae bacterium]MDP7184171.1 hypothetical protein [Paracoccaceae bacterium]
MLRIRNIVLGLAALSVSACAEMGSVTRNAPFESTLPSVAAVEAVAPSFDEIPEIVTRSSPEIEVIPQAQSYNVVDVIVDVPRTLTVSEANSLIPNADIVWQEEEYGDRYEQVTRIVQDAMEIGVAGLKGERDVILFVSVKKFHTLTKAARYTVGGGHTIHFDITLLDPVTGTMVEPTRRVNASFAALGGAAALIAESAGMTQKARISQQLVKVIFEELGGKLVPAEFAQAG